ncbi:putative ribosomal protein L3 [Candidatus Carsonella ruddii HC isolate Thao2000]|uniref:Large ribosomal subunit protein uL3 n=1 Tax=Candidatus Carsonella ruddii HC isolate Thao2000 TaxID=1202538 RepID=J3TEC3_CARRU|nr:putative ribosomal protein L3 [Candidatus Carsonella ruddii HC isolate Thao2000]
MIFLNKGTKHFFYKKKIFLFNIIKYINYNNFFLNFNFKNMLINSISKGKGFQGVIKRWNFRTKDKSHGCSLSYRTMGSTGQCQDPGRVLKGKKMPGRMGFKKISIYINFFLRKKNFFFIKKILPGKKNDYLNVKII